MGAGRGKSKRVLSSQSEPTMRSAVETPRTAGRAGLPVIFSAHGRTDGIRWEMDVTAEELIVRNSRGPWASRIFRGGASAKSGKPFDHALSIDYQDHAFRAACERPPVQYGENIHFPDGVGAVVSKFLEGYTGGWNNVIKLYPSYPPQGEDEDFYVFAGLKNEEWADFLAATA